MFGAKWLGGVIIGRHHSDWLLMGAGAAIALGFLAVIFAVLVAVGAWQHREHGGEVMEADPGAGERAQASASAREVGEWARGVVRANSSGHNINVAHELSQAGSSGHAESEAWVARLSPAQRDAVRHALLKRDEVQEAQKPVPQTYAVMFSKWTDRQIAPLATVLSGGADRDPGMQAAVDKMSVGERHEVTRALARESKRRQGSAR